LDFPKRRSYLVRNVYESPAQILTDEEAKLTQLDPLSQQSRTGCDVEGQRFSGTYSTYDSKYFCSGKGGPERSIIIYVHRPANLYRLFGQPLSIYIDGEEDRSFVFVGRY
jgi:hypothetical protein